MNDKSYVSFTKRINLGNYEYEEITVVYGSEDNSEIKSLGELAKKEAYELADKVVIKEQEIEGQTEAETEKERPSQPLDKIPF